MSVGANRVRAGAVASVLVIGAALIASQARATAGSWTRASKPAAEAQPPVLERYERHAAACPGLDPLILVAIHDVETQRDAIGVTSQAGAVGPMQFLPSTWATYGRDGNGDGVASPWDIDDALASATQLLCADGITDPARRASAVWNYNHSWDYVQTILHRAAQLRQELA